MSRLIDADALKQELGYIDAIPAVTERDIDNAPTIDAIPMEWLEKKRENLIFAAMVNSTVYGDNSIELCHAVNVVLDMWQKEQEVQDEKAK